MDTLCEVPNLYEALPRLIAQIPRGQVTTYGDLAEALGSLAAARWVGEFLILHPHDGGCPCHRVVRRTGEPGLYISGNPNEKIDRLRAEKIDVDNGRIDLERFGFNRFTSDRPLQSLTEFQAGLPERILQEAYHGVPELVAGVDISYPAAREAVGAYVLVDSASGRLVWSSTVRQRVTFPYIPGFLSFRESPLMLALLRQAKSQGQLAEVVFVDGNGILHPRRAGIASHLGVMSGVRTVGVGKKLLCGRVDLDDMPEAEPRPVFFDGDVIGMAVKSRATSRPVFVSPGHRIDSPSAVRLAIALFHGHRVPEPIYWADRVSRQPEKFDPTTPESL